MSLFWTDGSSEIHCADCVDVLPSVSADIAVTSPPYNVGCGRDGGGMRSGNKLARGYSDHHDCMNQDKYESWLRDVVGECLTRVAGLVWVNHQVRYVDRKAHHPLRYLPFELFCEVIWRRPGSLTLNAKRYAPNHEAIYGFGTPTFWDDRLNTLLTVWQLTPERNNCHPCPFPVELANRLIVSSCPPGGVVLDPFMGSGSTAVAAKKQGCRFIGIEKSEAYCQMAVDRLRQTLLF